MFVYHNSNNSKCGVYCVINQGNPRISSVIYHHSRQYKNSVNVKQHIACESTATDTERKAVVGKNRGAGSPASKQNFCSNIANNIECTMINSQVNRQENSTLLDSHGNSHEVTCNVKHVSEEGEQSSSGKWQYKAGVGVRGCPDQALEKCKTQMVEDVNPCICNGQYSANDSYKQLVKICVLQKC